MISLRAKYPQRKCGQGGPYEYGYKRLKRNEDLMAAYRAIRLRLNMTFVQITEEACLEVHAPDIYVTYRADTKYGPGGTPSRNQWLTDRLLDRLRSIREESGIPLADLIERACVRWIEENYWMTDHYGAALFNVDRPEPTLDEQWPIPPPATQAWLKTLPADPFAD